MMTRLLLASPFLRRRETRVTWPGTVGVNVIFDLGMVEFDSFYLYMPMQAAQDYFKAYEDVLREGATPPDVMASEAKLFDVRVNGRTGQKA